MTQQQLTPQAVEEIFLDCLFRDGEDTSSAVIVEGIGSNFGLHPDRVKTHKEDVQVLLAQLPTQFHAGSGDGWSFLNGCTDKEGQLWTGDQMIVEQLFVLGMALGLVTCLLPREMWGALPGSVPYYLVSLNQRS